MVMKRERQLEKEKSFLKKEQHVICHNNNCNTS